MKYIDSREGSVFEEVLQLKPIKSVKVWGEHIKHNPPPQGRCIRHWYGESMFVIYKAGDAVVIMVIRTGGGRAGAKQRNQWQQRAADRRKQHEWFQVWERELVTLQAQLHWLIWVWLQESAHQLLAFLLELRIFLSADIYWHIWAQLKSVAPTYQLARIIS